MRPAPEPRKASPSPELSEQEFRRRYLSAFADPAWAGPTTLFTGFAFTGLIYFVGCFAMSRYSLFVERRLNAHRRH